MSVSACWWWLGWMTLVSLFVPALLQNTTTPKPNKAPVLNIQRGQNVAELDESRKKVTPLSSMKCSDPDSSDLTRAYLRPLPTTTPCAKCFAVLPCGSTKRDFCLTFTPGLGQLSYSRTPSYVMNIVCTDDYLNVEGSVEVRLIDNQPPVFTIPATSFVNLLYRNTASRRAWDAIYQTSATDEEGDAIFYSLSASPYSDLFEIGAADGKIRATQDMRLLCQETVRMSVTIQDTPNVNSVGPVVINIDFKAGNVPPVVTSTKPIIVMEENPDHKASFTDTVVAKLTVADDTLYDSAILTMRAVPERGLEYYYLFNLRGKAEIRTRKRLDYEYEPLRSVRLYIDAMDGFCWANALSVLVQITDKNELPEIIPNDVERTVYEGYIEVDPGWKAVDPDLNERLEWKMLTTGGAFDIDPTSGIIRSIGEFKAEPAIQKVRTLNVKVTDSKDEQSRASIKLTVLDKNDNPPIFQASLYEATASECTKVGALIHKVNARDADSEFQGNNELVYGGSGVNITVLATGDITLNSQCTAGQTETIDATVTDQGLYPGPLSGVPATITFSCKVCPEPTDNTGGGNRNRNRNRGGLGTGINDNPNDLDTGGDLGAMTLGWMIPAIILGSILAALLAYAVWKTCSEAWERRQARKRHRALLKKKPQPEKKRLQTPPKKEEDAVEVIQLSPPDPPPPEHDPWLFPFWKETYVDRDQRHMPEREIVPMSVAQDHVVEEQEKVEEQIEMEERNQERQKVQDAYRQEYAKYVEELQELQNPRPLPPPTPPPPPPPKRKNFCRIL